MDITKSFIVSLSEDTAFVSQLNDVTVYQDMNEFVLTDDPIQIRMPFRTKVKAELGTVKMINIKHIDVKSITEEEILDLIKE